MLIVFFISFTEVKFSRQDFYLSQSISSVVLLTQVKDRRTSSTTAQIKTLQRCTRNVSELRVLIHDLWVLLMLTPIQELLLTDQSLGLHGDS